MITVYVHPDCKHCKVLTKWMLENIPKKYQTSITLQQASIGVTEAVPSIENVYGVSKCIELLNLRFGNEKQEDDPVSKFTTKKESNKSVEDSFNELLTSRKPPNDKGEPSKNVLEPPARTVPTI